MTTWEWIAVMFIGANIVFYGFLVIKYFWDKWRQGK